MSSTKLAFLRQPPRSIDGSTEAIGWQAVLKPFLACLGLYLAGYSVIRGVFYLWNIKQLQGLSLFQTLWAFVYGLRFDVAVTFPLCILILLAWLWLPRILFWIVLVVVTATQTFLFFANFIDVELVNFVGRRITHASLYLWGEGRLTNLAHYILLTLTMFFCLGFFVCVQALVTRMYFFKHRKMSLKLKFASTLLALVFAVIFIRGGLQNKPMSYVDAKIFDHPFAHQMILNTTFTFFKSLGQNSFERVHFFDQKQMLSYLNLNTTTPSTLPENNRLQKNNVVVFILEGFSSEYVSEANTPFFLNLARKGAYFPKAYANGRRSIEGIAAILAGIPALMEESFVSSEFSTNDFLGLGKVLKNRGYETSFFHGGQNGTMRFDTFTKAAGFDQYFGKNEFADQSQDDGAWGIFDEPFLAWSCEKMAGFKPPFASVIFTLSSHQPFTIPEKYKAQFPEGMHPIIKTIRYTDHALKGFFTCAEKQGWLKDTLFVFTADHTGPFLPNENSKTAPHFQSLKPVFEVPILFYTSDETKLRGLDSHQLAQHIDLLPTIAESVGAPVLMQNHLARSLWQPGNKNIVLYTDQRFEVVGPQSNSEDFLKATRQYFSEGLYDNRLYFPAGSGK